MIYNEFLKKQAFLDTCRLYEERFEENYCSLIPMKKKMRSETWYYEYSLSCYNKLVYSYWDETEFQFSSNHSNDYENPFSFTEEDFILDGKWFHLCKQFMANAREKIAIRRGYNLYDRIDLKPGPMKRLKKSYERFLYMAAKYPLKDGNGFIPPTYAVKHFSDNTK